MLEGSFKVIAEYQKKIEEGDKTLGVRRGAGFGSDRVMDLTSTRDTIDER